MRLVDSIYLLGNAFVSVDINGVRFVFLSDMVL
jgi:hypothetical protein